MSKVVKKKRIAALSSKDELASMEAELAKELRQLQSLVKDKENKEEFDKTFAVCEKRHRAALLKGKSDPNFQEFLKSNLKKARKELRKLKSEVEARKMQTFTTLVACGPRPKRERNVALIVSTRELYRILTALEYTETSFGIASPGSRPVINDVDRDIETGSLSAYLLRCALESGIGWATPIHMIHKDEGFKTETL